MRPLLPYDTVFQIVETMRWSPSSDNRWLDKDEAGYFLLERHVERMADSAMHAGFRFDSSRLRAALADKAKQFDAKQMKVRALLFHDGRIVIESTLLDKIKEPVRLCLSGNAVDSSDPFLYHKTTRRELYQQKYAVAVDKGCFDVIFVNERNEITEGAISNIFIERNGMLLTPPVSSGLLPGTLRQSLIDAGVVMEKALYSDDLQDADRIYCGNSVRGLLEAELVV